MPSRQNKPKKKETYDLGDVDVVGFVLHERRSEAWIRVILVVVAALFATDI